MKETKKPIGNDNISSINEIKTVPMKGGTTMKYRKKAIGYVCDIPIKGTTEVISKEDQLVRLIKHAEKENLNLVCVYEDEAYTEDFLGRAGVKKILDAGEPFDVLLVERVWCLSRSKRRLEPFLKELDNRKVELATTSYLWDCVSQQIRHRYMGSPATRLKEEALACMEEKTRRLHHAA
jgi:DNA invertase Pin-like site-specific DNA recombinase